MSVEHEDLDILLLADRAPSGREIVAVTQRLTEKLLHKNIAYGDSALEPLRILAKSDTIEQILVRMDDKLNRLLKGEAGDEDVLFDFFGYWVLLQVAKRRQGHEPKDLSDMVAAPVPGKVVDLSQESGWLPPAPARTTEHRVRGLEQPSDEYPSETPSDEALAEGAAFVDKVNPPQVATPNRMEGWSSSFGPVCQINDCENKTGNSERVVCPPCLQKRGFGSHMDGGTPSERSSEGTLRRA